MDKHPNDELRKPFPASAVGKLPRKTKDGRTIYLDYVGHAAVTDRLLSVDPEWDWEPLAYDDSGLPLFDRNGQGQVVGLWIELTVNDVTRLGYGSVTASSFDAEKQLIGDAIRNAAMRFGVALDLWTKADLESEAEEEPLPILATQHLRADLSSRISELSKESQEELKRAWREQGLSPLKNLLERDQEAAEALLRRFEDRADALSGQKSPPEAPFDGLRDRLSGEAK